MSKLTAKTGRPPKISIEEKKQIITNYFLFEAQGSAERMSAHNIYALLSAYANKKGYSVKPYDFSRDKDVKVIIQSMEIPRNKESSIIPAYIPLDIRSLMFKTPSEMEKILNERENYSKNVYARAALALEEFKSLNSQIKSLKDTLEKFTQEVQNLSCENEIMKEKNVRFEKENKYMKGYIKRTVEPFLAESIITGNIASELSKEAPQISKKGMETAMVPITDYIYSECENKPETVSAKSILKMLKKEEK